MKRLRAWCTLEVRQLEVETKLSWWAFHYIHYKHFLWICVTLGIHLSTWRAEASRICLCALMYTAHHAVANRLGLPHALRAPIHWLLIHQSEPKSSLRQCFYTPHVVWTHKFEVLPECRWAPAKRIGPQFAHTCQMCDEIFWQGKANHSAPSQILSA